MPRRTHIPLRRRVGALLLWAGAFASGAAMFVGCLNLRDTFPWDKPAIPEEPPVTVPDRQIRVLLGSRRPRPTERISITTTFSVVDHDTGRELAAVGSPAIEVNVGPSGNGIVLGTTTFDSKDILISPKRDAAIVLGAKTYRGRLRIQRVDGGIILINHVDIEGYLRGVLRGELPGDFHIEAFKTLAVAARTYALYQKQFSKGREYDVVDHEGSQVYDGVSREEKIAVDAVTATTGQVAVWRNKGVDEIFCTYYSSTCGGLSQAVRNVKPNDPAVSPLAGGVECHDCSPSPYYRWGPARATRAEVTKRIVARYPTVKKLGTIVDLRPKGLTSDGRIIRMEMIGSTGQSETLVGEDFRLAMGPKLLRSTNFTIEAQKDGFLFKDGKGFGHGMGLCQYGMDTKAKGGMGYEAILKFYYPGMRLKKLY